jgi:glycosyltransferase involved in cell wall biosynthesis
MSRPRVTVAIPLFNGAPEIKRAISSVLKQTMDDFEILVIDDGSTDSSCAEVESMEDGRIRLLRNGENHGIAWTRNRLVSEARGEFLAWLDHDDACVENRLIRQVEVFVHSPDTVLCGSASRVHTQGAGGQTATIIPSVSGRLLAASQLFWNVISTSTVMMRLDLVRDAAITFKSSIEPAEDYGFWFDSAGLGLVEIIDEVLVDRWALSTSASALHPERQSRGAQEVRKTAVDQLFPELRPLKPSAYRLLIEGVTLDSDSVDVHEAVAWLEDLSKLSPVDQRFGPEEMRLIAGAVLLTLTRSLCKVSPVSATKIFLGSDLRLPAARWAMRRLTAQR